MLLLCKNVGVPERPVLLFWDRAEEKRAEHAQRPTKPESSNPFARTVDKRILRRIVAVSSRSISSNVPCDEQRAGGQKWSVHVTQITPKAHLTLAFTFLSILLHTTIVLLVSRGFRPNSIFSRLFFPSFSRSCSVSYRLLHCPPQPLSYSLPQSNALEQSVDIDIVTKRPEHIEFEGPLGTRSLPFS